MKVFINGKYRLARLTGVQRVAVEIVAELKNIGSVDSLASDAIESIEVIEPPTWFGNSRFRAVLALLWEQLILPVRTRTGILLSLCNTGPILARNQVIVLHDAAVFDMPGNYGARYVKVQRFFMRWHAKTARRILTVSLFSRDRLSHWLGLAPERIGLLGVGVEHIQRAVADADESILARLKLHRDGYLLAIGSRQPGKNFAALLEAARIAQLPLPIVVVGGADAHVFGQGSLAKSGHLVEAGYISDEELVGLLKHARAYVQPSLYEGFGLPVIEAMALGVPVVCSNTASLPEVCGGAAILFDPRDPQEMAKVLTAIVDNGTKRRQMADAGLDRAKNFSWRASAARLLFELETLKL